MIAYSLILCSTPQNGIPSLRCVAWEALWWAFYKASFSRCLECCVVWFCLVSLVLCTQQKGFSLLWPWRSCSNNLSAAFWGELGSLFVWDQRNETCGKGVSLFCPHTLGSWAGETKSMQRLQIRSIPLPWRGSWHQRVSRLSSAAQTAAWHSCLFGFFYLGEMLVPSCTVCQLWSGIFPGILGFCPVEEWGGEGQREGGRSDSLKSVSYLLYFFLPCGPSVW